MAYFETHVLDNQIKAMPTVKAISNQAVATFDTDIAERLVSCVCEVPSGSDSVSVYVNSINIWNEEWEIGQYDINTGAKATNNNAIRSKDFIPIRAGTNQKVYFHIPNGVRLYFYGQNKNYLGSSYSFVVNASQEITFTLASAYYFTFYTGNTTTYGNNISINYPSTETGYNAFSGVTVDLGETLSGDGSLDVISGILTRSDDTTKHVDGNIITAQVGENNIYSITGDIIDLKYVLSVGQAIS